MKLSTIVAALASAIVVLTALPSTASATTLETNGVKQTGAIEVRGSLKSGTSTITKDTAGAFANTCTGASFVWKDSTATTGAAVSGPITSLSFSNCTHAPLVVDTPGTLSAEWIKSTTNGTVRSSGMRITEPVTVFGNIVNATCVTENTDIGVLTGVASGSATIDVNAVLNCGSILPSVKWEGTYVTTTSTGSAHAVGVVE